ncbi:MAG: outer membrane beta-barrel protein [Crocinitomicaceae bacterium]
MRLLLTIFLLGGFFSNSIAQNTLKWDKKKLFYGFNMGLNYTNIWVKHNPIKVIVKNGIGFNIGIFGGYKLTNEFCLVANTTVSFHNNNLLSSNGAFNTFDYTVLPTTVDFGLHATYDFAQNENKLPYLLLGPKIQISTSQSALSSFEFGSRSNISLEFGLGYNFKLSEFILAPEFRYSYGLRNVSENSTFINVRFHTVRLILNFKG